MARVSAGNTSLFNATFAWPSWLLYNVSAPWYVTLTWQNRQTANFLQASWTNTSVWYKL